MSTALLVLGILDGLLAVAALVLHAMKKEDLAKDAEEADALVKKAEDALK